MKTTVTSRSTTCEAREGALSLRAPHAARKCPAWEAKGPAVPVHAGERKGCLSVPGVRPSARAAVAEPPAAAHTTAIYFLEDLEAGSRGSRSWRDSSLGRTRLGVRRSPSPASSCSLSSGRAREPRCSFPSSEGPSRWDQGGNLTTSFNDLPKDPSPSTVTLGTGTSASGESHKRWPADRGTD